MNQNMACSFESLNNDLLGHILKFVGKRSYVQYGAIYKRTNEIFKSFNYPEETFLGYVCPNLAKSIYDEEKSEDETGYFLRIKKKIDQEERRKIVAWSVLYDNQMTLIHWCLEKDDKYLMEKICLLATEKGRLDILKKVFENNVVDDEKKIWLTNSTSLCTLAAREGHLSILKWLRSNGCKWDSTTMALAARGGHLEILKWSMRNGADWDSSCCTWSAWGGHLEVLQWARAHGCPWDHWTCLWAAERHHHHVLRWARENGCPEHDGHI